MSQVYVKRCDRCNKISVCPNIPNPPGWHCLADNVHGTLASFDLCPGCLADTGLGMVLTQRIRTRALGDLKNMIETDPAKIPPTLDVAELEAAIDRGEWDNAFASGDGVDLDQLARDMEQLVAGENEIVEGELVE